MNKPARFPRLAFTSIKTPRTGAPLQPVTPVSPSGNSQTIRALELQLRGAKLTLRERRQIQMQLDELA